MYLSTVNEKNIVSRFKESDDEAFEQLYQLYSGRLLGYFIKLVKSDSCAGELLQETFIKLWESRKNIDPSQSFRSYLFRIAENKAYDFFRKASRDKKFEAQLIRSSNSHYSHVEENICSREDAQLFHEVIDLLPPRRRQIFQLIKLEECSYEEVSNLLNISISTISDHIVKANKFILEKLKHCEVTAMVIFILLLL